MLTNDSVLLTMAMNILPIVFNFIQIGEKVLVERKKPKMSIITQMFDTSLSLLHCYKLT